MIIVISWLFWEDEEWWEAPIISSSSSENKLKIDWMIDHRGS